MSFFRRKPKPVLIGSGEFQCPNCRTKANYLRFEEVWEKPQLIGRGALESEIYVVCERCGRQMKDEDLRAAMPADSRAILAALKDKLLNGEPIQHTLTALISAGMPEREARSLVNAAAGILLKKCGQCDLTYVDGVSACKQCGHFLKT